MTTKASVQELKAAVGAAIDRSADEIIAFAEDVFRHPELGFRETRTAGRVEEELQGLGIAYRNGLAITGVRGDLSTGNRGPSVAIMGELDSVCVPDHPAADPVTGAAHACGHHMQLAALLGAGMGLVRSGVLPQLAGKVVLFAVPAEEYVEVEYRLDLVRQGKLEFLSGKSELVRLGELDDVDIAMMVHATGDPVDGKVRIHDSSNGLLGKQIQFLGKPSHAGAAPWDGVNALNAANLAISAMHAQRETFRDESMVRLHPIITKGGTLVNIVPDDVRIETYARARDLDAMRDASNKVDRACRAGAVAVGCRARITTVPGYLPLRNHPTLASFFKQNMTTMVPADQFHEGGHFGASTDMGDITHIMPALHPFVGGARGVLHGREFAIVDPALAYIASARALAMTAVDLLADGATQATRLLASFQPRMTRQQYLDFMRSVSFVEDFDGAAVGRRV